MKAARAVAGAHGVGNAAKASRKSVGDWIIMGCGMVAVKERVSSGVVPGD